MRQALDQQVDRAKKARESLGLTLNEELAEISHEQMEALRALGYVE